MADRVSEKNSLSFRSLRVNVTDDGLRMVMLTVFLVVAGGMTIWMRSSPGRVADRIGRVSSIDWWEKLATAGQGASASRRKAPAGHRSANHQRLPSALARAGLRSLRRATCHRGTARTERAVHERPLRRHLRSSALLYFVTSVDCGLKSPGTARSRTLFFDPVTRNP